MLWVVKIRCLVSTKGVKFQSPLKWQVRIVPIYDLRPVVQLKNRTEWTRFSVVPNEKKILNQHLKKVEV